MRLRLVWLGVASILCIATSRRPTPKVATFRPKKDGELSHPALRIVNYSNKVAALALKGPITRRMIAPPRENFRTLIPQGTYVFVLLKGGKVVRKGKVVLLKGHRYRLEVMP